MSPAEFALANRAAPIAKPQGIPVRLPGAAPYRSRRFNRVLKLYAVTDLVGLHLGLAVAWFVATGLNAVFGWHAGFVEFGAARVAECLGVMLGVLLWFQHTGHYRLRMPFWMEAGAVMRAMAFATMADGFLQFSSKQDFSRLFLVGGWLAGGVLILALRALVRAHYRSTGQWRVPTLVVGTGATAADTLAAFASEPGLGYTVAGQVSDLPSEFMRFGRSWGELCAAYGADYVLIALDGEELAGAHQPIAQLLREDVAFSVSAPLHHLPVLGMTPQYFLNHDVMLFARTSGLSQPLPRILKRAVDVMLSGLALIALSPVMLAVALVVKRDGGPALFGHPRVGLGGQTFRCLKFRSMVRDGDAVLAKYMAEHPEAHAEWEATRKLKDDPRVTWFGDFMRRTSLDELPQLINVLRGDMSLVGPRPIVTAEVQKYESDIAHYYRVRPGITGLWQVSGRSDVTYAQRVRMDSWYVRNWSLWHDIAIICKTFPALLQKKGAY